MMCYLMRQRTLQHAVPGDLTHVAGAELEDLGRDGVLLHEGFLQTHGSEFTFCIAKQVNSVHPSARSNLSVVELHRVVGGEGNHEALLLELQQRVLGVLQEQAVVAEGGHGDGDLGQEVQILQHRTLELDDRCSCSLKHLDLRHAKNTSGTICCVFSRQDKDGFWAESSFYCTKRSLTFLRLRPWEMLSAVMKAASKWVMAPASPQ